MAVVVPAMAAIGSHFAAGASQTQFVISAYLFGLGLAQPLSGFLCDRLGRRPVVLVGFTLFVIASFACALAEQLPQLVALRFLQAVGVSVGTVASRAVIRDTRDAEGSAEAISYISAAMGVAPIVAPILGGWLISVSGFQLVFVATGIMGGIVLIWMMLRLSETLSKDQPRKRLRDSFSAYPELLKSRVFVGYTLTYGFVQGSFFSFLAVGANVFETSLGIGARQFGLIWGCMAVTYVGGATLSGRLTRRLGARRILKFNVLIGLVTGWGLLYWVWRHDLTLMSLALPLALLMATSGAVIPGAIAGAVNYRPDIAGTSSGLSSSLGILLGGGFTILSGVVYESDFEPIAALMALSSTLTALSWLMVHRVTAKADRYQASSSSL